MEKSSFKWSQLKMVSLELIKNKKREQTSKFK